MADLKPCDCGRMPKVHPDRVAEDCYETQVRCACGNHGAEIEGPYPETQLAILNWNDGERHSQPLGGNNG